MGIALSTFQKPRSGSTPLTVEASDNILGKPATETTIDAKEKREQEEFLGQFQLTLVNQELRIKQAISQLQKNQALVLAVDTWIAQKDWRKLCETIISYLLKVDADVNSCDAMGKPVLYKAVECNANGLVNLLLNNEAEVNCTYQNKTPLAHALQMACPEINSLATGEDRERFFLLICKDLIAAGATFIAISTEIEHYQAIKNFYEKHIKLTANEFKEEFQKILKNEKDRANFNSEPTNLVLFCTADYQGWIRDLISETDRNAALLYITSAVKSYTELTKRYFLGTLKHLLQQGAEVNAKSDIDQTPVSLAMQYNKHSVIQCLVKAGALWKARTTSTFLWIDPPQEAIDTYKAARAEMAPAVVHNRQMR